MRRDWCGCKVYIDIFNADDQEQNRQIALIKTFALKTVRGIEPT